MFADETLGVFTVVNVKSVSKHVEDICQEATTSNMFVCVWIAHLFAYLLPIYHSKQVYTKVEDKRTMPYYVGISLFIYM